MICWSVHNFVTWSSNAFGCHYFLVTRRKPLAKSRLIRHANRANLLTSCDNFHKIAFIRFRVSTAITFVDCRFRFVSVFLALKRRDAAALVPFFLPLDTCGMCGAKLENKIINCIIWRVSCALEMLNNRSLNRAVLLIIMRAYENVINVIHENRPF